MNDQVVIDAGPLVAAINHCDQWHDWSAEQFARARPPLLTCEAVIFESWFLLGRSDVGCESLVDLIDRGVIGIGFSAREDAARLTELMRRYADIPMSWADACLVRMTELVTNCQILTLDSDFRTYRRHRRKRIPLLIPDDV